MMPRPNPAALTALLALLTGIAPMSVDMYLASLPDIARNLMTSDAQVQLTLSFYLVGFAVGQVIWGRRSKELQLARISKPRTMAATLKTASTR